MQTMTMRSPSHQGATPSAGARRLSATSINLAADRAVAACAPEQRPRRAAATAANAATDALPLEHRSELV